jgi:ABC-2 type transport system ATP-binding protein
VLPDPKPASVSVRELSKSYGGVQALKSVSFEVSPGEVFGLLGPNGAGKTTALECILGLRRPSAGAVEVDGMDVSHGPGRVLQRIGAQIQGALLQDKITPRRALGLFASFYQSPAAIHQLVTSFGLEEKYDAPFDSLSTGQRQRLFLALALVNDPRLVVLDEPTAGLDPKARKELHGLIAAMRLQRRTVLMSTHDMAEAASLCDRVAIIDAGSILAVGSPAQIAASTGSDTLEDAFLSLTGRMRTEDGDARS